MSNNPFAPVHDPIQPRLPGLRKCNSDDPLDKGVTKAAELFQAVLDDQEISQRRFTELCDRDLKTVQSWLNDGHKRLPFGAFYRLPKSARMALINKLFFDEMVGANDAEIGTGTDG